MGERSSFSEALEPRGAEGGDEGSVTDMGTASRSSTHTTVYTGLGRVMTTGVHLCPRHGAGGTAGGTMASFGKYESLVLRMLLSLFLRAVRSLIKLIGSIGFGSR